jgi:hypothetical protein
MRKTVTVGNGNGICGERGMEMAEHSQNTENENGLCGEGGWEWQPTPYRFNK